jgi:hypothetical protein
MKHTSASPMVFIQGKTIENTTAVRPATGPDRINSDTYAEGIIGADSLTQE